MHWALSLTFYLRPQRKGQSQLQDTQLAVNLHTEKLRLECSAGSLLVRGRAAWEACCWPSPTFCSASHFLSPKVPITPFQLPCDLYVPLFPPLQRRRKEVWLAEQVLGGLPFVGTTNAWGGVCVWRGDVLGILKAKALASERCGDLITGRVTGEKAEAHRGELSYPRSCHRRVAEPGLKSRMFCSPCPLLGGGLLTTTWLRLSHRACFSLTLSGLEKRSGQPLSLTGHGAQPPAHPSVSPLHTPEG